MSPIAWIVFLFLVYIAINGEGTDLISLATTKGYQLSKTQNKGSALPALPNLSGVGQAAGFSQ